MCDSMSTTSATRADKMKRADAAPPAGAEATLTEDELRRSVAKGDANPQDVRLQRELGRNLYLYAINTGQTSILPDAARILRRAHEADPNDYETTVLLGNALFDAAQSGGDPAQLAEARRYYQKALAARPDDADVRTELGLTYFFGRPSEPERAIREYRRALAVEPRHEMTLQSLAAALIATGELAEARQRLDELQALNASNAALPNLRAQLAQSQNAAKE